MLTGAELYEVTVVRDYVRLGFHPIAEGPHSLHLTALTSVAMRATDGRNIETTRNPAAVIDRINSTVVTARIVERDAITLVLTDGATLVVSLRDDDVIGPETATLRYGDDLWVW